MLRTTILLLLALPALLLGGESCARSGSGREISVIQQDATTIPAAVAGRGEIVSFTTIETRSAAEITSSLRSIGLPDRAASGGTIYKVVYRTIDVHGRPAIASGTLALPTDRRGALPLVGYQHGTVLNRRSVSSVYGFDLSSLALVGSGYAVASADYLGLGDSPGLHPYVHAASLASAVVDMLRAARALCATEGVDLNDQLFLMGYSEGGYATMAAAREIEEHHSREFTLTASAPMAGPYDMSGVMRHQLLSDRSYGSPYYLPYVLLAYREAYGFDDALADVFRAPYAERIPTLFDGDGNGISINGELPSVPRRMLTDRFIERLQRDSLDPMLVALRRNDLTGWSPRAPMRLYHGRQDDLVPYENSVVALRELRAHGGTDVELVTINAGGHGACALPSLAGAKRWFDSLKK